MSYKDTDAVKARILIVDDVEMKRLLRIWGAILFWQKAVSRRLKS